MTAKSNALKVNRTIRAACLNVRGLNKITKRELLMDIMRKQNYEVMLLSETNVNTSSFEVWNGFTCFFSSSIDPKIREREEKKRESKTRESEKADKTIQIIELHQTLKTQGLPLW